MRLSNTSLNLTGDQLVMLLFSFTIAFLLQLLLFAISPLVSVLMNNMALSHFQFGLLFSVPMFAVISSRIPWGLFVDKKGAHITLKCALPVIAIAGLLRAFSPNYLTFLFLQLILGLGLGAILPCLPLIVKEWAPPKASGLSTGVYVSGFAVGNAAALGLTPLFLNFLSWRVVLVIYGGVGVIVSVLWYTSSKSSPTKSQSLRLANVTELASDKLLWVLILFTIVSLGCYDTLAAWMPRVLRTKRLSSSLATLLPLGFFLAGPIIGTLMDRADNKFLFITTLSMGSCFSIAGINYTAGCLLSLCIFFSGFFTIGIFTVILDLPAHLGRFSGSVGTVVGIISSLGNIGPLIVPTLFGLFIDISGGFLYSFLLVSILSLVPLCSLKAFDVSMGSQTLDNSANF